MIKVASIVRICPHYRVSTFEHLAKHVDLTLYYGRGEKSGSNQNAKVIDGFKHKRLFTLTCSLHLKTKSYYLTWFPSLILHLIKNRPQVIISEGTTNIINNIPVYIFAKLARIPFVWGEAGRNMNLAKNKVRRVIEPILTFFMRQSDACIGYTEMSRQYFLSIGVPNERIFITYNTVDFGDSEETKKQYSSILNQEKEKLSLTSKKIILYVGSIEKRKRLGILLKAFRQIKLEYKNVSLLIIGDGPEKSNIEAMVITEHIEDVHILGRIVERIGLYFMLSDVLVLPGSSSLAINQAMLYGKPVITVAYGGPEYEFIKDGESGFILKRGDDEELKEAILKVILNDNLRIKMGETALSLIKKTNVESMVDNIIRAIHYAYNRGNLN
ncbi:MAG: glycosyltransferase family 4 protein [Candidatus Omnitrophota bacterium]